MTKVPGWEGNRPLRPIHGYPNCARENFENFFRKGMSATHEFTYLDIGKFRISRVGGPSSETQCPDTAMR